MEHLANSKGLISDTDETATTEIKRERQRIELVQPSHTALAKKPTSSSQKSEAIPQVMVEEVEDILDINPAIFRAYDIRGNVEKEELTPDVAKYIGLALGSELLIRGENSIVLGWDGRTKKA